MSKEKILEKKYVNYTIDSKSIKADDSERNFTAIISTSDIDRDMEVLIPEGCNRKVYLKNNPIILLNHDASLLPIGRTLDIRKSGKNLVAKGQIATGDDLADKVWNLMSKGFLHSISVGFKVLDQRSPSKLDIQNFGKGVMNIINSWELLEFSIVVLPSQANAVVTACKSMDIDPKDFIPDYEEEIEVEVEVDSEKGDEEETQNIVEEVEKELEKIDIEIKTDTKEKIVEVIKEQKVDMQKVLYYFKQEVEKQIRKSKGNLF